MNIRALATKLIAEVLSKGHSLSQLLPIYKSRCKNAQDAAFLQALVFGVIRWYPRLSFIAHLLLEKPLKQKDIELLYLITIGLYQLMDMHVSTHAALSETVEAARQLNKPWGTGLVNAVLRSYQRQSTDLQKAISLNEEAHFAHPQWIIDTIKIAWPNDWESILIANNIHPPLSLRINCQKENREHYLQRLSTFGIEAVPIAHAQNGIVLKTAVDVSTLPGFSEGLFSVQDGAAQLAAEFLQLSPGLRVLDACAAPGGKTTHILETEPLLKEVVALDISPLRTQLINENLARLQLKATVLIADANQPKQWWDGQPFDRILLDAPCSATGVIRRHPDIKYLRKLSDITKLQEQQLQLLNSLWLLLKPGGILVYATCSVFPAENVELMRKFLNSRNDTEPLVVEIAGTGRQTIGHQLLPGLEDMDGFYYASIRKS